MKLSNLVKITWILFCYVLVWIIFIHHKNITFIPLNTYSYSWDLFFLKQSMQLENKRIKRQINQANCFYRKHPAHDTLHQNKHFISNDTLILHAMHPGCQLSSFWAFSCRQNSEQQKMPLYRGVQTHICNSLDKYNQLFTVWMQSGICQSNRRWWWGIVAAYSCCYECLELQTAECRINENPLNERFTFTKCKSDSIQLFFTTLKKDKWSESHCTYSPGV